MDGIQNSGQAVTGVHQCGDTGKQLWEGRQTNREMPNISFAGIFFVRFILESAALQTKAITDWSHRRDGKVEILDHHEVRKEATCTIQTRVT